MQLALLHAAHQQFIVRGAVFQLADAFVEIVVLDLQLGQQGLQGLRVVGQVHAAHLRRLAGAWQCRR